MIFSDQFDTTYINDYTEHNNSTIAKYWEYIHQNGYDPKQLIQLNRTTANKIDFIKAEMLLCEDEYTRQTCLFRLIKHELFKKEIEFVIEHRKIIRNLNTLLTVNFTS